jgi:hypothetical protein
MTEFSDSAVTQYSAGMAKGGRGVPMVSTGGDQCVDVAGAFRQQRQLESVQESVSDSSLCSAWHCEFEQQDGVSSTATSVGTQQEIPAAALTTQQHTGIAAAMSSAMKRRAVLDL